MIGARRLSLDQARLARRRAARASRLTCGTPGMPPAGRHLRAHQTLRLVQYSAALYQRLEAETGQATGWKQCGSVLLARTPERMTLLRRVASAARAQNVACELMTPQQAGEKYPIMRTDDLVGALWLPDDAKVNPADVTQALAKGARMGGARIFEQTRVTAISARRSCGRRRDHARRHHGRDRRQLAPVMGQAGRAPRAASRAAALSPTHVVSPPHPGCIRSAGAARPRRLHHFKEEVGAC